MANRIQVRRDTAANWTTANPVLAAGEPALETDTGRRKTGDGTTAWTALPYVFDKTIADGIYTTPAAADAVYAPITGSTNYVAPAQLSAAVLNGAPAMIPLANISKAKTGPFRVLHVGTSIADGVDSAGHMLGEQLKAVYGDSGLTQWNLSMLGGTTQNVWQGWNKQPYGGHGLTRIRGNSASTALTFKGWFDTAVLEWSQETDSTPFEVVIDGASQGFIGTSGAQLYNQIATFPLTLGVPTLTLGTTNTTGGTFGAGTFYWKITAYNSVGETVGSNEVTATLTANGTQVLTIGGVNAAAGYNIYRGTVPGAENVLVGTVAGQAATTFTDTGTAGTTGAVPATGTVPALGLHTVTINPPVSGTGYAYLEWLELQNSARTGVEIRSASLGGSSISDMTNVHNPVTNQVTGIPIVGNNGLNAFFNRTDFDLIIVQDVVNDAGISVSWAQGGYQTSLNYGVGTTRTNNVPVISIIEMGGHYSIPNDNGSSTNNTAFNTIRNYQLGLRSNNHWTVIDWHGATILADLNAYMLRYYAATNLNVTTGTFTGDFTHPTIVGNKVAQTMVTAACGIPTPAQSSVLATTMDRIRAIAPGVGLSAVSTTDGTAKSYPAPAGFAFQGIGPGASSAFQGRPVPYYVDTAALNRADQAGIKADIAASATRTAYGKYRDYTLKSISLGTFVNWAAGAQVMYTIKGSGLISLRVDSPVRFYIDGVQLVDATQSVLSYQTSGTQPVVVSFVVGSTANNGGTYVSGRIYSVAVTNSTVPLLTS